MAVPTCPKPLGETVPGSAQANWRVHLLAQNQELQERLGRLGRQAVDDSRKAMADKPACKCTSAEYRCVHDAVFTIGEPP